MHATCTNNASCDSLWHTQTHPTRMYVYTQVTPKIPPSASPSGVHVPAMGQSPGARPAAAHTSMRTKRAEHYNVRDEPQITAASPQTQTQTKTQTQTQTQTQLTAKRLRRRRESGLGHSPPSAVACDDRATSRCKKQQRCAEC